MSSGNKTTSTAEKTRAGAVSRRRLLQSVGGLCLLGASGVGVAAGKSDSGYQLPDGLPADFREDEKFSEQYMPKMIRAPQAWTTTLGSDDVTIGVIDCGVDHEHPDLTDRFGSNKGNDYFDDDENPDEEGIRLLWDYDYGESDWDLTLEAHGTGVAGVAAATTGNGTGISGVSNSRLVSARVSGGFDQLESTGAISGQNDQISLANIEQAVTDFAEMDVDIINLSISVHPSKLQEYDGDPIGKIEDIIDHAVENEMLVVTGSGNRGNKYDDVNLPGSIDEVLCVAGVNEPTVSDESQHRWDADPKEDWEIDIWEGANDLKSQTGPSVDVVAPADEVLTTWPSDRNSWLLPSNTYDVSNATSIACPVVTGVAALALSKNPALSPAELRELIRSSARDLGLAADKQGAGLVDAANAVEMA